ncbi:hypothetical protein Scep_016471 [Stephania cephalantha]|uniref:Uncharacterized protein n=1 Tax=Stephania cephalantha TaxID=152367 RepID=A0AAP0IMQ9_9MAGN
MEEEPTNDGSMDDSSEAIAQTDHQDTTPARGSGSGETPMRTTSRRKENRREREEEGGLVLVDNKSHLKKCRSWLYMWIEKDLELRIALKDMISKVIIVSNCLDSQDGSHQALSVRGSGVLSALSRGVPDNLLGPDSFIESEKRSVPGYPTLG